MGTVMWLLVTPAAKSTMPAVAAVV